MAQHDDLVAEYRRHSQKYVDDLDLMLASVLSVLQSQAEHIGDDQRRRDALNAGLEIWKITMLASPSQKLSEDFACGRFD